MNHRIGPDLNDSRSHDEAIQSFGIVTFLLAKDRAKCMPSGLHPKPPCMIPGKDAALLTNLLIVDPKRCILGRGPVMVDVLCCGV